ncbi:MAG: site-specific integrase, partial [Clostridia bacterium]|nr:site-specific integrase [Clostridia bacterium]
MKNANGMGSYYKLSGNRRKPFIVRKTIGWDIDPVTGRRKQLFLTIGYAATQKEAQKMLDSYNENPYNIEASKITFAEVYEKWSKDKFPTISDSNIKGYMASYKCCEALYDRIFKEIKLIDLQRVVDTCGKNYPTLRKLRVLFNQLYEYAMKYELCNKDYSQYVDIAKHKDKNPNKTDRSPFSKEEISSLWVQKSNRYVQVVLMLIYSGVRISELLNLKCENVNLEEHCFDVIKSKTENGIRKVPIADKVYDFWVKWYNEKS